MNSTIGASRLVAVALCGAAVVACDSVKDVRESPTYAVPPEKVSITGRITGDGVGTTRPVGLKIEVRGDKLYAVDNDDETDDGQRIDIINGEEVRTNFFSLRGVTVVNFGAADIGASYVVSVTSQPFGRVCSVVNGSGTVTAAVSNIEVECVRDATPLYHVNANLAPGLAAAPPPGFKLRLTTEEGVQEVTPEAGATTVAFTMPVIYPGANPPLFAYRVTATYEENGMTNNCAVTNGSGELGTGSGDVNDVTVTSCGFAIAAVTSYSLPPGAPPGPPPALGAGLELSLKDTSGAIVAQTGVIAAFSPIPVAFPGNWASNAGALYEVIVTSQPAGQFCTVDNGGMASLAAGIDVTAQVRCRDIPAEVNQLTGTYQVVLDVAEETADNPRPLATAPERHFMTFFANGTFLYGVHHSSTAAGVEHGFYNYNPGAQTLDFSIYTDSSAAPAPFVCRFIFAAGTHDCPEALVFGAVNTIGVSATGGLTGLSGYTVPVVFDPGFTYGEYGPPTIPAIVSATGVVKTAAIPAEDPTPELPGDEIVPAVGQQINLTFGTVSWTLVEPISPTWGLAAGNADYWPAGETEGAWVTADSKRVWIYEKGTTYGWHAGVNGAPNLQDMCFGIEQGGGALGYETFYSRRIAIPNDGFSSTCTPFGPSAGGVVDVPSAFSTPALVPGFAGRFPGASTSTVLPPSPAYFKVTPGASLATDTLTVQGTQNGLVTEDPLVFTRSMSN